MQPKKFTLGPAVTIGEQENIVRLSHAEWNELVRLVKSGELRAIGLRQARVTAALKQ